jgi:ABC-type multidrug transport system fused ATPase/permease subunit
MLSATQVLAGIRDVKLCSRERYFVETFGETYKITTKTHAALNVLNITPPTVLKLVSQVGLMAMVLALWSFGSSSAEIAMQVGMLYLVAGKFVPAASSTSSLLGSLWNAAPQIEAIHRFSRSIEERIQQEHRGNDEIKPPVERWRTICFMGVGFQYPNSSELALRSVNLKVERGRSYAIVGRSAAGKSTLVDLLVALLPATEGKILIDDHPLESFNLQSWRSRIGYVPQSPYISDSTLRANVAFGIDQTKVDDEWVIECLRLANLEDLPHQLEKGLNTYVGERGIRLSGGQRQRIAIARALFNRPEVLILDEATSALDSISEREIMKALENLRQHMTLVIIAHRLTTVMSCDHIFLLENGSLVAEGNFAELAASQDLFRQMAAGLADTERREIGG